MLKWNMVSSRLLSLAAGVIPELIKDPARFVEITAGAGWKATGVWFDQESWSSTTSREVKRRMDDNGLEAVDMEVIRLGRSFDTGKALIEAACEVGAKNILVVSSLHSSEETAEQLSHLCSLAKAGDITICLEFMKFTSVKSLSDALEVVKLVDAPNVGILLDLLHVVRS
ncbi:MAG: TIM barrel protein, partial [Actinomycetota bacterium]|nr:TIM barrel protein [Actinomycetota bacterium]